MNTVHDVAMAGKFARIFWALYLLIPVLASAQVIPIDEIQVYDPMTGDPQTPYWWQWVTVEGVLYVENGTYDPGEHYIQDATGGIRFYDPAADSYAEGDRLRVTGRVLFYLSEITLMNPSVEFIGHGPEPTPILTTINNLVADYEQVGNLVSVFGVVADTADNGFLLERAGETVLVFLHQNAGVDISEVDPGDLYRVVGACQHRNNGIAVLPRRQSDLVENPPDYGLIVNPDGSGDYPTIQEAIAAALPGETIQLIDGVYTGDGNRDLDYLGKAITIRSQSGNPADCIIDCQGSATEPHRGIHFHSNEGEDSVLQGITITGGWMPLSYLTGGAILCNGTSPSLVNCVFADNRARHGGAVAAIPGSPRIIDCVFRENLALTEGGGIYFFQTNSSISGTVFANNQASQGGAIHCIGEGDLTLTHCTLVENRASQGSGTIDLNNSARLEMASSIIAFGERASIRCSYADPPELTCCDIYGNGGFDWAECIQDLLGQNGNISADPLFCDRLGGVYTLKSTSPCLPENGADCEFIGAMPLGCEPNFFSLQPDGSGDYPTIQAAVDAASDGDVIALADGTYAGAGNRDIVFQGKTITLQSVSGDPAQCIIDCQGTELVPHRGFDFSAREVSGTVLTGVTIRNGFEVDGAAIRCSDSWPVISNCAFEANLAIERGGAILCDAASPFIVNCVFRQNVASTGAGIQRLNGSNPFITHCTFYDNTALEGAVYECATNPAILYSIIAFNSGLSVRCTEGESGTLPQCCDVFGNSGGDWTGCISGAFGSFGNISADPLFCAPEQGELSLQEDSPCAAANNAECGLIGALPAGCGGTTDIAIDDPFSPSFFGLTHCYPNPFNPSTTVSFALDQPQRVNLAVYDISGRRIADLADRVCGAGPQSVQWDGRDFAGQAVSSGLYVVRMISKSGVASQKVMLLR